MKVYVVTDMEGVAGVHLPDHLAPEPRPDRYRAAVAWMTGEVNAAIAGAFDGGAEAVVVCDGHGGAPHMDPEALDARAEFEVPGPPSVLPSLDPSFGALLLVGYHARAGTAGAVLPHTQNSAQWVRYTVNGEEIGEIGQMAAIAGHHGVPLALVTGDRAATEEARALFAAREGEPPVTVAVKHGFGPHLARHLHPRVARERIRAGAADAVRLAASGRLRPLRVALPPRVELELATPEQADAHARRPGVERLGPTRVGRTVATALELLQI